VEIKENKGFWYQSPAFVAGFSMYMSSCSKKFKTTFGFVTCNFK
jgi:hypothetical protein